MCGAMPGLAYTCDAIDDQWSARAALVWSGAITHRAEDHALSRPPCLSADQLCSSDGADRGFRDRLSHDAL